MNDWVSPGAHREVCDALHRAIAGRDEALARLSRASGPTKTAGTPGPMTAAVIEKCRRQVAPSYDPPLGDDEIAFVCLPGRVIRGFLAEQSAHEPELPVGLRVERISEGDAAKLFGAAGATSDVVGRLRKSRREAADPSPPASPYPEDPMPEIEEVVTTVRIQYVCDAACGGVMQYTGVTAAMHPPLYQHACPGCGRRANLKHVYPRIDYRPLPGAEGEAATRGGG